ncbi:Uncharacterised protein [uncultured archaeon]|nr:Uncharacterised protein [uncultured archaeon]
MKDKIAVFSSILLGIVVGLFATVSLVIDAFMIDNLTGTLIDLIIMGFSYMTAWIGIRHALMEKLANDKMDREWDYKIEPIAKMLTDTVGRMNAVEMQLMETSQKVDTTLDYMTQMQDMDATKVYILPGVSFKFITKVLVLIIFTFSALVYVVEYPLSIVHYFILVIYLAWWALFTAEYKLFDNKTAWIWALTPIMTVPVGGIILDSTLGVNNMVGILFFFMFIYAYLYYSWAAYMTVGFKLIDLSKIRDYIIRHSDTYLEQKKAERKIDRKWIDAGILLCIALAGVIAVWLLIT